MLRGLLLMIALSACGASNDRGDGGTGGDAGASARDASADPDAGLVDASSAPHDGAIDARGPAGEPAELAGITRAHNDIRAMVDTPTPLPELVWDDALAATAATYLARCIDRDSDGLVDHNADRSIGHPFYVGENIYASTGTATGAAAVASWASEVRNYHAADNTCDAGKVCGHYTQIVWRATLKIGCALRRCAGLTYASTILCDYGPGGNVGQQRPY